MAGLAEHFLQAQRDFGVLATVINRDFAPQWGGEGARHFLIQRLHLVPAQPRAQRIQHVEAFPVLRGLDPLEIRQKPILDAVHQGGVGHIRHILARIAHQPDPRQKTVRRVRPGQTKIAYPVQHGLRDGLGGRIFPVAVIKHERAKAFLLPGDHAAFAF